MTLEASKIVAALAKINDPGTGKDLITMNMVKDLKLDDGKIQFTLLLPQLNVPYKSELNFACQSAMMDIYPNVPVHVHMEAAGGTSQLSTSPIPHVKNVIAVASGKGGVGKSTVSVNLALSLQALGATVGIMDADLYGPSLPTMLNLRGQRPKVAEQNGKHKLIPLEAYGMPAISIGNIIEEEQAVVLRGPRLAAIIKQFFEDTIWPPLDYLIVDLPPGTGDIQLTLVQTVPVTGAVLVTTPQEVAIADAVKAMNMFLLPNVKVPILGVVENMSWFTPEELPDHKYELFGSGGGKKLAKLASSVLLGQVPLVQGIREGGDVGSPISTLKTHPAKEYFANVARNLARQIAYRNEMLSPTSRVELKS